MIVVYLSAFASLYIQIPSLFGRDGLLPVKIFYQSFEDHLKGKSGFFHLSILAYSNEINQILLPFFPILKPYDCYENIMHIICFLGIVICILILYEKETHLFNNFFCFSILWFFYFSIFSSGQCFFSYQWDTFLLEVGFLALFYHSNFNERYEDEVNLISRHLLKWLLFRVSFSTGIIKLLSHCTTWWSLSSLNYHFQSQCLPNSISWIAHNYIPNTIKRLIVSIDFFVLIFVPMFFFFPYKPMKYIGAFYQIILHFSSMLTGNTNFFNLLAILIALSLFDDRFLDLYFPKVFKLILSIPLENKEHVIDKRNEKQKYIPSIVKPFIVNFLIQVLLIIVIFFFYFPKESWYDKKKLPFGMADVRFMTRYGVLLGGGFFLIDLFCHFIYNLFYRDNQTLQSEKKILRLFRTLYSLVFCLFIFTSSIQIFSGSLEIDLSRYLPDKMSNVLQGSFELSNKLKITNHYGLYRKMPGIYGRLELVIEGSHDGIDWKEYEFYYKPIKINERPKFAFTHQPRIDWQMCNAALGNDINSEIWLINLIAKIFKNSPAIMTIFKDNPFPVNGPNYIRIKKFKYWFTNKTETKQTGDWWKRKFDSIYLEPIHRNDIKLQEFIKNNGFENFDYALSLHILQEIPIFEIIIGFFLIMSFVNLLNQEKKNE